MRFRWMLAAVVLISTFAAAGDEWNKTYKVGATPSLTVTTSDAGIEVHAGGSGTINANFQTEGYSITGSDPDMKITESQAGDDITINVRDMHHSHFCFACTMRAHMTITAPAGTKLTLRTADGSLKVYDFKAPAELRTSDGSIEVRGFDGVLHARTSDGSIHASGRFEDLRLDTSDGSVTVDVEHGSKVNTDWRIHTSDGSVRVALPEDLSADLNLSTGDGSVHSDLPINDVHGPIGKRSIVGKLGQGGRMLEIRTGDGSVRLTKL